jgi:hypothetical protein
MKVTKRFYQVKCYKTFHVFNLQMFHNKLDCLSLASLYILVKCLWMKQGVGHLKGASLGQAVALFANISLGYKGLLGINTLAYLEY